MIFELIIDKDSPLFLNLSSPPYRAGKHYAQAFLHPLIDEKPNNEFDYKVFGGEMYHSAKDIYKSIKGYKKAMSLLDLYKDVKGVSFYIQHSGLSENLILNGLVGKRITNNFTIMNKTKALKKLGLDQFNGKSASLGWMIDAGFEIAEWGGDALVARLEGKSLTIEQHTKHLTEVSSTAIAGTATLLTAGLMIGIASTGVGIPVIAMLIVPYIAGSLAKSGYNTFVDYQIKKSGTTDTSRHFIPDEASINSGACTHMSCHASGKPDIRQNAHLMPFRGPVFSNQQAMTEILNWIKFTSPLPIEKKASSCEFSKQIKLN